LLETYDFIVLPTTPNTAFKLGENDKDPISMYLEDIFTVQASLAGLPAISIPNGQDKNGLPIGFQVIGRKFGEKALLNFCNKLL
jgi:aspartyl-tRNA(Asn)/glutamyl-tRNA(Gln) amidotransferase subunit A